jgi:hypothetical protein
MRRLLALALCLLVNLLVGLWAPPAAAQPRDAVAEAKRLFRAGARAYDAGQFAAAVQAFEQAFELSPRPPLLFSAAQALRRQYTLSGDPSLLHRAKRHYERYIAEVKSGGRVKDATEALEELGGLLAKHQEPAPSDPAAPQPEPIATPPKTTGTLQLDSAVGGAVAHVRGRAPVTDLPQWLEVEPGTYEVTMRARGHVPVRRKVRVEAGRLTLVDPVLIEKPGRLTIVSDAGAEILIDGRPQGRAPLPAPLELTSGRHRVVVGADGNDVYALDLELGRGEARTINADLSMSTQRIVAWVVLGGAAVTVSGGILLAIGAASQQRQATDLATIPEKQQRAFTVAEADEYNAKLSTRDNLLRLSAGAFVLGGVALAGGLLLFGLDEPDLYAAAADEGDDDASKEPKAPKVKVDALGLVPAPGGGAVLVGGRF